MIAKPLATRSWNVVWAAVEGLSETTVCGGDLYLVPNTETQEEQGIQPQQ